MALLLISSGRVAQALVVLDQAIIMCRNHLSQFQLDQAPDAFRLARVKDLRAQLPEAVASFLGADCKVENNTSVRTACERYGLQP